MLALRSFGRADPRVRFCLAWYIPFWIVLEIVGTKLPHYVLPAYPGVILLIGWAATQSPVSGALRAAVRGKRLFWYATAFGLLVVTLGLAALAIGAPIYLQGALSWWSLPAAALILLRAGSPSRAQPDAFRRALPAPPLPRRRLCADVCP